MSEIEVEVVFALPDKQSLLTLQVEVGTTVAEVVAASGLVKALSDNCLSDLAIGVWGHEVEKDREVKSGDRIEIYRPLEMDPREARRQLALAGRTMSDSD